MQRPEAFKFRGNTGNTGYGFELVEDPEPQVPQNHEYQFMAPGNRGSLVARKAANQFN